MQRNKNARRYFQFGGGDFKKSFENQPVHRQLCIQSTYLFLDDWDIEAGYMKVNTGRNGDLTYAGQKDIQLSLEVME